MFDPQLAIQFLVLIPITWIIGFYIYSFAAFMVLGFMWILFIACFSFFHYGHYASMFFYILITIINFYKPSENLAYFKPFLLAIFLIDFLITAIFGFGYIEKSEYLVSLLNFN